MAPPPDAILAFASGTPLVALGVLLLFIRPWRTRHVFFAVFAILWGLQVSSANFGRIVASASAQALGLLVSYAFMVPAYLFLVHFATMRRRRAVASLATIAIGIVAFAAVGVLVLAPEWVVSRVEGTSGPERTVLGPAALPLFLGPFFGSFLIAIGVLYAEYRRAVPGTTRHGVRGLLLALVLFSAYHGVRQLFVFLDPRASVAVVGGSAPFAAFFLVETLVVLGIFLHLFFRPPPPEERDRNLLLAFAIPATVAVVEGILSRTGESVESLGFWRFATVAALAYALAKYQLFDLDLRLRRVAGPTVASLALGYGLVVGIVFAASGRLGDALPPLGIGVATAGGALLFRDALGEALFPGARDAPDYVRRRKFEVYRASLEERIAAGLGPDDRSLRRLRRELDISEREHDVLRFLVEERLQTAAAPASVPAPFPRAEPGAKIGGRYRVDRLLGEGGFGRAFLAFDERENREVVLKAVAIAAFGGAAAAALEREARILREIDHPNVIRLHDVLEGPQEILLVMEYAALGNLGNLLRRKGELPFEESVRLLDGILAGLEAAHARGVVHRDVKPENVLLMNDGSPKVADFGVARETRPDATAGAAGAGTLLYMAPEQVRGLPADARADLYAAAVVFHQAFAGRFYLRIAGKDDFQVRKLILEGEPILRLDSVPPWVGPFLRRALAKAPDERFPDARAMRESLRNRG